MVATIKSAYAMRATAICNAAHGSSAKENRCGFANKRGSHAASAATGSATTTTPGSERVSDPSQANNAVVPATADSTLARLKSSPATVTIALETRNACPINAQAVSHQAIERRR